ncbi:MAG: cation transporter [Chromatiaceae bacterium]|nr:MAG: cation transporter [Chromatiaceae bacterium]
MPHAISARPPLSLPWRLLLLALLWSVIAGRDPLSWMIGLPTVVGAALMSWRLDRTLADGAGQPLADTSPGAELTLDPDRAAAPRSGSRLSLPGLLRFLPFFVGQSVLGGVDVATRVMRPRVRVAPGLQIFPMRLRDPVAQIAFLNSISLLPGTLSADLHGCVITVHALDSSLDVAAQLRRLEHRVADLFGERLGETPDRDPSPPEEAVTDG